MDRYQSRIYFYTVLIFSFRCEVTTKQNGPAPLFMNATNGILSEQFHLLPHADVAHNIIQYSCLVVKHMKKVTELGHFFWAFHFVSFGI